MARNIVLGPAANALIGADTLKFMCLLQCKCSSLNAPFSSGKVSAHPGALSPGGWR